MTSPPFLTAKEFSALVGISERKARQALKGASSGKTWRGTKLQTRRVHGRGGAAGLSYEVARDSIPQRFFARSDSALSIVLECSESLTSASSETKDRVSGGPLSSRAVAISPPVLPPAMPRSRVTGDSREAAWRLSIIQPVMHGTEPGSRDRAQALSKLAAAPVQDWQGRPRILAERTVRGWMARYQKAGLAGLMRKTPENAGERRVCFSRQWDAAAREAGLSEAAITDLVKQFRKRVRGEWASGTPSWPTIQLNALPRVVELSRKAGMVLPDIIMREVCTVPRRFIEAERRYHIVAVARKDAGRFAAEYEPRIERDRSHLLPGDWIAGDVHATDMLFLCEANRVVTPKAVSWLCLATNRTWTDIFIMPKGEMIRTEHVAQSLVNLFSHPDWGVCSRLYVDNGGEYNWTDLITDLSKLKHSVEVHSSKDLQNTKLGVQKSRPHNPQGKVIEGLFANLEGTCFAQLPGWIAGDRMRKKTTNHGREPVPFPGDETQLRQAITTALAYYHAKPQSGHLGGLSPNQSFAAFVANGWTATVLDPWEMAVAFSHQFVKPVRAGGTIRLDGVNYRADAMQSFVGSKVIVRRPMFGDRNQLFIFTEYGVSLAIARPDVVYAFGEDAGAKEQGRRAKSLRSDVKELTADACPHEAGGEAAMADVVKLFDAPTRAQPPDVVIRLNPEFSAAAQMGKNAPAREADEADQKLIKQAEKYAFLERLAANSR